MEQIQKVKIKIIDLGRDNFNGTFIFEGTTEGINQKLEHECRKHLISSDVSCNENTIFAGFHAVGKIEIIETIGSEIKK